MASGDLKKLAQLTMDLAAKGPLSARVLNANNTFHVITVPKKEYIAGIKNAVPSLTDEEAEKIHETLILLLLKHENTTYKRIESGEAGKEMSLRGEKQKSLFTENERIVVKKLEELKLTRNTEGGKQAFLGMRYDTLSTIKGKDLVNALIKQPMFEGRKKELSPIGGRGNVGIQLEHGGVDGMSAIQLRDVLINQALDDMENFVGPRRPGEGITQQEVKTVREMLAAPILVKNRITRRVELSDDGKYILEHASELTATDARLNQEASTLLETPMSQALDKVGGLLHSKGSPSLAQAIEQVLFHALTEALQGKTGAYEVSLKGVQPKRKVVSKSSGEATKTIKHQIHMMKSELTGSSEVAEALTKKKKQRRKGPASTPLQLIGAINKNLPAAIKGNMGAPRLENRTGRLADSVKVTSVLQDRAKNIPTIEYTYQKDPYEVFEMGRGNKAWATNERDPRSLIEFSIRESAAELALNRFMLRRV